MTLINTVMAVIWGISMIGLLLPKPKPHIGWYEGKKPASPEGVDK